MSTLQTFQDKAEKLTGVQQLVMVARDGTVLSTHGNKYRSLGDYVGYIAVTIVQLKPYLHFTGPYHLIMEQSSGDRIVTLLGKQVLAGIYLDAHVSPATVLEELAPIIDQVTI